MAGCETTAQAHHEKTKKLTDAFDDKAIKNMIRYCHVEEQNFDALLRYMKNRGITEEGPP